MYLNRFNANAVRRTLLLEKRRARARTAGAEVSKRAFW